jgi:hypothetical protein
LESEHLSFYPLATSSNCLWSSIAFIRHCEESGISGLQQIRAFKKEDGTQKSFLRRVSQNGANLKTCAREICRRSRDPKIKEFLAEIEASNLGHLIDILDFVFLKLQTLFGRSYRLLTIVDTGVKEEVFKITHSESGQNPINLLALGGHVLPLFHDETFLSAAINYDYITQNKVIPVVKTENTSGSQALPFFVYDMETFNSIAGTNGEVLVYSVQVCGVFDLSDSKPHTYSFIGQTCLMEFILFLFDKLFRIGAPKYIAFAHNGAKFDAFFLLVWCLNHRALDEYSRKLVTVDNDSFLLKMGRIMNMTLELRSFQNNLNRRGSHYNLVKVEFRDDLFFLPGKEADLAIAYDCEAGEKGTFVYEDIKNWEDVVTHREEIKTYGEQDARILYELITKAQEVYTKAWPEEPITNFLSIASWVRSIFFSPTYYSMPTYWCPAHQQDKEYRQYFRGGRVEIFRKGVTVNIEEIPRLCEWLPELKKVFKPYSLPKGLSTNDKKAYADACENSDWTHPIFQKRVGKHRIQVPREKLILRRLREALGLDVDTESDWVSDLDMPSEICWRNGPIRKQIKAESESTRLANRVLRKFFPDLPLEVTDGQWQYIDATSMYPTVMCSPDYDYPTAAPVFLDYKDVISPKEWKGWCAGDNLGKILEKPHFLLEIKYRHLNKGFLPFFSYKRPDKTVCYPYVTSSVRADNDPEDPRYRVDDYAWGTALVTKAELFYIFSNDRLGMQLFPIEDRPIILFPQSGRPFDEFITAFYKHKSDIDVEMKKLSAELQTCTDETRKAVIKRTLKRLDIERGPAKGVINNGYGFNAIKTEGVKKYLFTSDKTDVKAETLLSLFPKTKQYSSDNGQYSCFEYRTLMKTDTRNIYLAIEITNYARLELYKMMNLCCQHAFEPFYCDTDSVRVLDRSRKREFYKVIIETNPRYREPTQMGGWKFENPYPIMLVATGGAKVVSDNLNGKLTFKGLNVKTPYAERIETETSLTLRNNYSPAYFKKNNQPFYVLTNKDFILYCLKRLETISFTMWQFKFGIGVLKDGVGVHREEITKNFQATYTKGKQDKKRICLTLPIEI